ncbi:MAG: sigma-54 dependent transcriptional regulator [Flavobacteriales bacterium]
MNIQPIKQRFGIIGNSPLLDRAVEIATEVGPTDLSALITGESGSGKEVFPKIIHANSARKHQHYFAVNCGAIPEGTIDSELFGHEKGAFTGAHDARKGYFETADGGTLFLDEVGELPLTTQVRLLRVLETGEFIRVGSSKAQKTNVRVVAATNVNMLEAIAKHTFREDLYYRLNTVPITVPPLRERRKDIHLLFRKFAQDTAEKYRKAPLILTDEALALMESHRWPGNVRQLRNIVDQMSLIEKDRTINAETLKSYLPPEGPTYLPALAGPGTGGADGANERELIYKFLFDLKNDLNALKAQVLSLAQGQALPPTPSPVYGGQILIPPQLNDNVPMRIQLPQRAGSGTEDVQHQEVEESLSITDKEKELIRKAITKHRGRRKYAAEELGISERTLYRKIKEYEIK